MKHFLCFRKLVWVCYVFVYVMCLSIQIDKFKQSVIRAFYTDDSEKKISQTVWKI
jgi:hypothetical protein